MRLNTPFLTNDGYNGYVAKYMSRDIFNDFNDRYSFEEYKPVRKILRLYTLFSLNDFINRGIVWMYYSFEIKDKNNNIVAGSLRVPFVIYLKRDGWHWRIVRKDEEP